MLRGDEHRPGTLVRCPARKQEARGAAAIREDSAAPEVLSVLRRQAGTHMRAPGPCCPATTLAASLLTLALLAALRPAPKTLRTRRASCTCGVSTTTSTLCMRLSTVCLSTQGPFLGCPLGTSLPGQGCPTSAQRQTSPSRSNSLVRRSLWGCKQPDVGVCVWGSS